MPDDGRADHGRAGARDAFLGAAQVLVAVLRRPEVIASWDEPSALDRMTVGALAAHAARAVSTPLTYLDRPTPEGGIEPVSASGYVIAVLGGATDLVDDVDAPVHVGVRDRAAAGAEVGPGRVADQLAQDLNRVATRLATTAPERLVAVRDGVVLTIDEYLRSRIVELVVHLDDLHASVDGIEADVPDTAAAIAIEVLADLSRLRHGWQHTVRHLARRERATGLVAAL